MAKMLHPLMVTFIDKLSQVPSGDTESVFAATQEWLRTNWQPASVRPHASAMLVFLATQAGMLTDPSGLLEYIQKELSKQ